MLASSPDIRSSLALSQGSSAGVVSLSHGDAADIFKKAIPAQPLRIFMKVQSESDPMACRIRRFSSIVRLVGLKVAQVSM